MGKLSRDYHDLDIYQQDALTTKTEDMDEHPDLAIARIAFGVPDEAGEVAGAVKKYLRGDFGELQSHEALVRLRERVVNEAGDVLWYLAVLCRQLDIDLSHVAWKNRLKLRDRKKRDKIKGDGDKR